MSSSGRKRKRSKLSHKNQEDQEECSPQPLDNAEERDDNNEIPKREPFLLDYMDEYKVAGSRTQTCASIYLEAKKMYTALRKSETARKKEDIAATLEKQDEAALNIVYKEAGGPACGLPPETKKTKHFWSNHG